MNKADIDMKKNISKILYEGYTDENPRPRYKSDGKPAHSRYITQVSEKYDIANGESVVTTLRPTAWKSGINELLAIYQTQTNTHEGFSSHDVNWWIDWCNEDGNIGRAYSYNLESHRPNEMKRELIDVKPRLGYGGKSRKEYTSESVGNFTDDQIEALKMIWEAMHSDKDALVHIDWHDFENFLKDVRYLPQYHLAKEMNFKTYVLSRHYYKAECYHRDTVAFIEDRENELYRMENLEDRLYGRKGLNGKRYELSKNQVNELIKGLKENPYSRRHMISFFNWANQDKKMLVECAFMTQWAVRKIRNDVYLDTTLTQRSSDYTTAGTINNLQYAAFQLMIAHEVGMKAGSYQRNVMNMHIYEREIENGIELLRRPVSVKTPKLVLNAEGKGFYDITIDDFELIDYEPTKPQLKFDIAI